MAQSYSKASPYKLIADAALLFASNFKNIASVYVLTIIPSIIIAVFLAPSLGNFSNLNLSGLPKILTLLCLSVLLESWSHLAILETIKHKTGPFLSYTKTSQKLLNYFFSILASLALIVISAPLIFPSILLFLSFLSLPSVSYGSKNLKDIYTKQLFLLKGSVLSYIHYSLTFIVFIFIFIFIAKLLEETNILFLSMVAKLLTVLISPFFVIYSTFLDSHFSKK